MGIGHFIWFPEGVDAPFDESFPTMLEYVKGQVDECAPLPAWLSGDAVPDAEVRSLAEVPAVVDRWSDVGD